MISVTPAGLNGTANPLELPLTLLFKEKLCRPFCVNNATDQPRIDVEYHLGTPFRSTEGNSTFVPVNAIVTVVSPGRGCKAITQVFNERFMVSFQGDQPTDPVRLERLGHVQVPSDVKCCKTSEYSYIESVKITFSNLP